jgi:hypothetical protein
MEHERPTRSTKLSVHLQLKKFNHWTQDASTQTEDQNSERDIEFERFKESLLRFTRELFEVQSPLSPDRVENEDSLVNLCADCGLFTTDGKDTLNCQCDGN